MDDTEARIIRWAWDEEGSIRRMGMMPSADKAIQNELLPAGGEWKCIADFGDVTRRIVWDGKEVALLNPQGDLTDKVEGQIGMALRASPTTDKALRVIAVLAASSTPGELIDRLALIGKIARAAVDYIEQPAPELDPLF